MSDIQSDTAACPPHCATRERVLLVATIAWVTIYLVAFYSVQLPNNPDISRLDLLQETPWLLLDLIAPAPGIDALPSGWKFLVQRIPLWLKAAGIVAAAAAAGQLLVSLLGLPLQRGERWVLAYALGIAALATLTLLLGLCGVLSRNVFLAIDLALMLAAIWNSLRNRARRPALNQSGVSSGRRQYGTWRTRILKGLPFVAFGGCMLLAASLPPTDFDVREYHLQGPREYFEAGAVQFLGHNVYTSFPFLTEMLSLHGMVVCRDWFEGALVGKVVLMTLGPMSAWAVGCLAARLFGSTAGWLAALVHISTPWTYRISIIAYAEGGLTLFTITAALAVAIWAAANYPQQKRWGMFLGLLAGSAMACKYPGLISVVFPIAGCLVMRATAARFSRESLQTLIAFALGLLLTVGPWLGRNLVDTGNPVYPLAWSVFGGREWDDAMDAKWKAAHSSTDFSFAALGSNIQDVILRSDWLSGLLFAFAGVGLLAFWKRSDVRWIVLVLVYLFATWWLLTHRIDRFWIPLIPLVAVLAGGGLCWSRSRVWTIFSRSVLMATLLVNLAFITTVYCGNNAYLADMNSLVDLTTKPGLRLLNRRIPSDGLVLCVGEAEVFDARFPLVYHTVFDDAILEQWSTDEHGERLAADAIHDRLRREGITHIYVNWREILRYRATYGYTSFVTPELFESLISNGVLEAPETILAIPLSSLPDNQRRDVETWGREMLSDQGQQITLPASSLYRVRSMDGLSR